MADWPIGNDMYCLHGSSCVDHPMCTWVLFYRSFMNSWLKFCWNLFCSNFDFNYLNRSEFCTCHDSWAVMACAKFWPDWNIIFHVRTIYISYKIWIMSSWTMYGMGPWPGDDWQFLWWSHSQHINDILRLELTLLCYWYIFKSLNRVMVGIIKVMNHPFIPKPLSTLMQVFTNDNIQFEENRFFFFQLPKCL